MGHVAKEQVPRTEPPLQPEPEPPSAPWPAGAPSPGHRWEGRLQQEVEPSHLDHMTVGHDLPLRVKQEPVNTEAVTAVPVQGAVHTWDSSTDSHVSFHLLSSILGPGY